jgi:endonuclease G
MKIKLTLLTLVLSLNVLSQELPRLINYNDQMLEYDGYKLSYNESHEQANWVFYILKPDSLTCEVKAKRKNKFMEDFSFETHSATLPDYKGSGYDRGHLKPAAAEPCNQSKMNETFYLTNISPQDKSFNRGIWKRLENFEREVAEVSDSVYVFTGPVLTPNLDKIGFSGLSVPLLFYKVLYVFKNGEKEILCYLIPNMGSKEELDRFIVNLDQLEIVTKIDFP